MSGRSPGDDEDAATREPSSADAATLARQRALGGRLRSVRLQQGLSLAQVETASEGRWKAVVVGAYERGDRSVTIGRLAELASFYRIPLSHLLPVGADADDAPRVVTASDGVVLDLVRLRDAEVREDAVGAVARFADRICLLRGDHGGRVLTLRDADLRTLAMSAGMGTEELRARLAAELLVAGA